MAKTSDRRKSVLIVQHAPHEHPAAIRRALESQGIQTRLIHPYRGELYPRLDEVSGMISLGGPMGANDDEDHPWIPVECQLLRASVEAGIPTIGICLGGQLMARATGGRVERNSTVELGWFPIELNANGRNDPVSGAAGKSPTVYQWHQDTFHLPPDAVLLAGSQHCPRQAFRIQSHAYGFQFHPEADHQLIHEWLSVDGVEEEILEVQKVHGSETVQDGATQKNRATKGEKASLKITAAIASLFRRRERDSASREIREKIQQWVTRRRNVVVQFEGSGRKPVHIEGKITSILSISAGDFVLIQEPGMLLWPIRIDDIIEISLKK